MPLIALTCPNCQANIDLDDSREFGFCSYCGTKMMLQDVKKSIEVDETRKLNNLIDVAITTLPHESAQNIENMANRILELDSSNWHGWFLKGASQAKSHNCKAMYEYWTKSLDKSSKTDFDSIHTVLIHLVTMSLISDTPIEGTQPTQGFTQSFDRSSEGACFSYELIQHIIDDIDDITPFQAGYLMKYLSCIVSTDILKDGDIRPFLRSSNKLRELIDILPEKTNGMDSNVKSYIQYHTYPYQCIQLKHHKLIDEDLADEIDYWNCHDISEYTRYLTESIDASKSMYDGEYYRLTVTKMTIRDNIDALFKTYLMMGEEPAIDTKRSIWDRLNI